MSNPNRSQHPPRTRQPDPSTPSPTGDTSAERGAFAPGKSGLPAELMSLTGYEDVREIGRGGMGAVFRAKNTLMDRLEVLKVIGPELADREDVRVRFLREVQQAAKLSHPNVVMAYAALPVGRSLALSMEYVPGRNLADVVKAAGPLPVATACEYVYQAALGLQHAHERGMVHRDIKPGNLMLVEEPNKKPVVKVLDFGLAKSSGQLRTDMTGTGVMLGTPDYMAPEQESDALRVDTRADVYALGGTLHYLLTGKPPYVANSLFDLLYAHKKAPPPMLDLLRSDVPRGLAEAVARMLAKRPEDRPPTPGAVAEALAPFRRPGGTRPHTPLPPPPPTAVPVAPPLPVAERLIDLTPVPPSPPVVMPKPHTRRRVLAMPARSDRGILRTLGGWVRWACTWAVILLIWFGTIRFFQLMFWPLEGDRPIPVIAADYKDQVRGWWNGLTK